MLAITQKGLLFKLTLNTLNARSIKLLIKRGPIFEAAKETTTSVIEKVTPATPIKEVAIADSTARAPAGWFW